MVDAKIDLFDCSFSNHFNFLWHVNTSINRQVVYEVGTERIRCKNMERQLGIHGFDPNFNRDAIPTYVIKKCFESTVQVINGIPIVGIVTGSLSALVYYLYSRLAAGTVSRDIENLCPGQSEKAKALLQLAQDHYLNEIDEDGNVSEFLLVKLASVIVDRRIEQLEELSQTECERIFSTYLKTAPSNPIEARQQLGRQFYLSCQKTLYANLYVAYLTNLCIRSLLSIVPFFKPCLRAVQWIRGVQDGR